MSAFDFLLDEMFESSVKKFELLYGHLWIRFWTKKAQTKAHWQ